MYDLTARVVNFSYSLYRNFQQAYGVAIKVVKSSSFTYGSRAGAGRAATSNWGSVPGGR
jgi:hypothetical protein